MVENASVENPIETILVIFKLHDNAQRSIILHKSVQKIENVFSPSVKKFLTRFVGQCGKRH